MDNNNRRPTQSGGEPAMDAGGDWRLDADCRQRIVTKITDTLKRHLPFSGQEGLQEIEDIAVRFEKRMYTAATSQVDYLRKISLKMLIMETKYPMPNTLQSNSSNNGQNPPDPDFATELDEGEVFNPGPITPVPGLMDNNNRRPTESGGEPAMDAGGFCLHADSRQRIVTKITDTLKRHLPFSGQEGLQEIEEIAVRFEEKIYTAATSQSDYLRKISLKMLIMETKNPMPNTLQSNSSNNGQNPPDPDFATELDEGEVFNPGPITPVPFL